MAPLVLPTQGGLASEPRLDSKAPLSYDESKLASVKLAVKPLRDRMSYSEYVEHPRYGRGPRITGLNPSREDGVRVCFHWRSDKRLIPNTAIKSDEDAQNFSCYSVTHYFDEKRRCEDCGKPFIFFAEEQKHWYEELFFPLDADCVRCVPCRKREQGLARLRHRYEVLFHVPTRTSDESLEMAECALTLMEAHQYSPKLAERVRMLLNQTRSDPDPTTELRRATIKIRLEEFLRRPEAV